MKLPIYLSFLCFLLLFAHRIKGFDENDEEQDFEGLGENLNIVGDDYDFENFNSVLGLATAANNKTGHCDKDEFKCTKSGECIDRYKVGDYIVDCLDSSDETKAGTCDFRKIDFDHCGWKDGNPATPESPNWMVINGSLRTVGGGPSKVFKLTSPNLHMAAYNCKMILSLNIKSNSQSTGLYVSHIMKSATDTFHNIKKSFLNASAPFTEVIVPIKPPPVSEVIGHGVYTIEMQTSLLGPNDLVSIQQIHFEDCNPKRTALDCDFEGGNFCLWKLNLKSPLQWNIVEAMDVINTTGHSVYLPTVDHTTRSSKGHYAWSQTANVTGNQSPIAVMSSPPLSTSVCFSLWYYMDGASFLQLSITSKSIFSGSRNRDVITGPSGGIWKFKQSNVKWSSEDYTINIEAEIEDAGGIIAIDDVRMKYGTCHYPMCTFEEGNCGYSISKSTGANSSWTLTTAQKMQDLTSMTFPDHTTGTLNGHMMLFIPHTEGDISTLTSADSEWSGPRCLVFWYYISDDDVGTLEVYHHSGFSAPDLDVDKKNGYVFRGQSTLLLEGTWRRIQLSLPPLDESVIDFIATGGSDVDYGFIALDDISITNDRCSPAVSCDMEADTCGWHLDGDLSMAPFERQTPGQRRRNYCVGPSTDHTLNSISGHYFYFCYHNNQQMVASIKSEDFDGHQNWCFSFWTYFTNVTNIHVDVYLYTMDGNTQLTYVKGSANKSMWEHHEMNIAGNPNYEIYYLGITVTSFDYILNQGVAIDDISLTPFKCGYQPKPVDPNHPGDPKLPPETELFDYECSFEVNTCNFFINNSHGALFSVSHPSETTFSGAVVHSLIGPATDHTTHSATGGFLELSSHATASQYATLQAKKTISPDMFPNATIAAVCVDFWYVLNGQTVNWLNVSVMSSTNDTLQTVARVEGTYGPTWRHKSATIEFFDDFYLYFFAGSEDPAAGFVGIDDIKVNVGRCPFESTCDFQTDGCGWDNNVSLPLRFHIASAYDLNFARTSVNSSVPIVDHSTGTIYGNYMYLNASGYDSVGQSAALISPVTRPDKKCLQFWYYFFGDNVGSLNVYVVYNGLSSLKYLLKSEVNSDVNAWGFNQIPLERHYFDMDFQFVIEVVRGGGWGDTYRVDIDDVQIKEFCSPIGTCDFETGFCDYSNLGDLVYKENLNMSMWTRSHARPLQKLYGKESAPPGDHTVGQYGVFAYFDMAPAATLYTPYMTISSPMCLTFYYFFGGKDARSLPYMSVELAHLNVGADPTHPTTMNATPIARIDGKSMAADAVSRGWRKHQLTVTMTGSKMMLQFTGFIGTGPTTRGQFVAIDDISFVAGSCGKSAKTRFACVPNPKTKADYVPMTKRCDFSKDCQSGADEENCGYDCIFSPSVAPCDWKVKNVTSSFLRVDLAHTQNSPFKHVMPLRDHKSFNDYQGTYMRLWDAPGPFIDNPEANYESPWIQNSGPLCGFMFYLYMNDPVDRQALVRVNIIRPDNPLGVEVFRKEAMQADDMRYWTSPAINIGRIRGQFKIQINARMKIKQGGGAIAIDELHFYKSLCMLETVASPGQFNCGQTQNKYKCANHKFCFAEDMLCDYNDDCGDLSDEIGTVCDISSRGPLRCDFESGTCNWQIRSHLNKTSTALNGLRWGSVDELDDYAYGIKRDHTLNNEFGHVLYLWNQQKQVGRIESPLMQADTSKSFCTLRFYFTYQSKAFSSRTNTKAQIGSVNIYVKFSKDGPLYKYDQIPDVRSPSFERHEVPLIAAKTPFYVVIEIVPGKDNWGIWAIDDISFTSGCVPADPKKAVTDPHYTPYPITTSKPNICASGNDTTPNQFLCDGYMCIQRSQVCDFYIDCDDSTDESNCGENTFGKGWKDSSEGRLVWAISPEGVVKSELREGLGSTAYFNSVAFGPSGAGCTLTFSYYVATSAESLELTLIETSPLTNRTLTSRLFASTRSGSIKYGKWNVAKVFIGEHNMGWRLQFAGAKDAQNNQSETLKMDGVSFANCLSASYNFTNCGKKDMFTCGNGVCIPKSQLCDYQDNCGDNSDEIHCSKLSSFRCSFEGGKKTSPTCDLDLSDKKWKRFAGYETRGFMGPGIDHTTDDQLGHFMMLTGAAFSKVTVDSSTTFSSPLFDPDSSGDCHLRFWYMMNGVGTLSVERKVQGATDLKLISSIDTSPNDTFIWKRYSMPLVNKLPYQIVFSGKIDTITSRTFIAVDDISFTAACKLHGAHPPHHHGNGTTPKPGKHCLMDDQFECQNQQCITFDEVCDFYPTCTTGEDELDCPATCDFDHNVSDDSLCFWGTNDDDGTPVHISASSESAISAASKASFYPKTDNTLKTAKGKYLLIYGINKTATVDKKLDLNIYSPEYVSAAPGCLLSLDYYIATDEKNGGSSTYTISMVEVTTGSNIYELKRIVAQDSELINKWNSLSVGIGRRANTFQIVITREHNPKMTDCLAIDNIRFTGCAYTAPHDLTKKQCPKGQFTCGLHYNCIPMEQVCDEKIDCPDSTDEKNCTASSLGLKELNFEAADGFNSSGWTLGAKSRTGNDPWSILRGPAPQRLAIQTGPPFDHTYFNKSGHYLYSRPFDFGVDAWFLSPVLKATTSSSTCRLLFYYYMYGLDENKIEIYVRNVKADNIIDTKAFSEKSRDEWRQASLTLQSPGSEFQVIISGVSGGDYSGIAIDDILLSAGCVVDSNNPTIPPGTAATVTTNTPEPTPSPGSNCQAGQWYCAADKTCLPAITKCNMVQDCSDGTDEAPPDCTQATCPIANANIDQQCGLDIFYSEGALAYSWVFSTAANFTQATGVQSFPNMPATFIYMDLSAGHRDDYSNLVSKTISETGSGCMLRFTYACKPSHCPLQVSIIAHHAKGNVKELLWVPLDEQFVASGQGASGYQVHTADIYLGRRNTYQISIGSLKQSTVKDYILISNIAFLNCGNGKYSADPGSITCSNDQFQCAKSYGNCIPKADVCDYQNDCRLNEDEANCKKYIGMCNMENFDLCDFWQFEQSDPRWSFIFESGQHGLAYLPSIDHTKHSPENSYLSFHSNQLVNYLNKNVKGQLYEVYFVSNGLIADSKANCRFRFWYNLIGPANCKLVVLKRYNTSAEHQIGTTLVSRMEDFWQKADILLSPPSGDADLFQIVLRGEVKLNGQPCSVNVDDVSFTSDCVPLGNPDIPPDVPNPNTTWNLCKPNFQCANHQCYSFKQICNFVSDCDSGDGDNTDEASCPSSCTFDDGNATSLCGWYTPKGLKAKFIKIMGPSPSLKLTGGTGPKSDHTTGNGSYIVATDWDDLGAKIMFHSPVFSSSGPSCRFSFAYFLNEPGHLEKITLYLKSSSHPPKLSKLWSYNYKHAYAQMWNTETANVGMQKNRFSLFFEVIQKVKHSKADFALDDFQFTNCAQNTSQLELICAEDEYRCDDKWECIDYWKLCDGEIDCDDDSDEQHCTQANGTCWFADENWRTECHWIDLNRTADFTFIYEGVALNNSKVRPETNTGPQDLLNGQYGYVLMRAKGHKFGETAAIASPVFPASSGVCSLNFHYYMYGADTMGELLVYTLGEKTGKRVDYFHLAGNQGPSWHYVDNIIVGGPPGESFRVVFEGIVGSNHLSDIAIGYVSFSRDCAAGKWVEKSNMNLKETCHGFYCHISHECISQDWVCDRSVDCQDGTDELNCKMFHNRPSSGPDRKLIFGFVAVALVLVIILPVAVFGYRRYSAAAGASDRVPFFDNSFETTSHRDLDFTTSLPRERGTASKALSGRMTSRKEVNFEMTTKKSNLKDD